MIFHLAERVLSRVSRRSGYITEESEDELTPTPGEKCEAICGIICTCCNMRVCLLISHVAAYCRSWSVNFYGTCWFAFVFLARVRLCTADHVMLPEWFARHFVSGFSLQCESSFFFSFFFWSSPNISNQSYKMQTTHPVTNWRTQCVSRPLTSRMSC